MTVRNRRSDSIILIESQQFMKGLWEKYFRKNKEEINSMDPQFHTQIRYVNMKPSEALSNFIQDHIRTLQERISVHPNKYSVNITVKANAKNAEAKITSFEVDGTFCIARRANLRASEKMSDVHQAITAVSKSLEKQIRRLTEKLERSRKTIGKSLKPIKKFKSEAFSEWEESQPPV
jgi:ribosomal subunit interface protein